MEGKVIKLPPPRLTGELSLEECICRRRSVRRFSPRELTLEEVSQLLWAGGGITDPSYELRAVPSAGALYPLEIYPVMKDGVYRYDPSQHSLTCIKAGDIRDDLMLACLHQSFVRQVPLSVVIAVVYERIMWKYGDRGIRYAHIEAGHVAQNIHLEAVALGLGSVPVGAFRDERVQRVLSLPQDHQPVYILPIGHP